MKNKIVIIISVVVVIAITCFLVYLKIKYRNPNTDEKIEADEISFVNIDDTHIPEEMIGILEIDKINMKGFIKEGSTSDILKDYIGHIENTPIYDGNICLAAHNRGNKYSYFARLNELTEGDKITYKTIFGETNYIVNNKQEIDEEDWSNLEDTDENKITLITCIKNKKNKRLCVQATKI